MSETAGTYRASPPREDEVPGGARSALAELADAARRYHDVQGELLRAFLAAGEWGGVPAAVGMDTGTWLELVERLPRALVGRAEAVAGRLASMPACAAAWADGVVTFDELCTLVRGCGGWSGEGLAMLDEQLACLAADLAADDRMPDLEWEVDVRVQRLRAPGWAQRQERRTERGSEVRWQMDFDGGGLVWGSFDPVGFHTVVGTIDAYADPATAGVSRARQRARALVEIAEVASGDGGVRRGRPTVHVLVDLASATTDRFGQLLTAAGGAAIPTLSARLTETLADHGDLLVHVTEGARPIAELRARDIPAAVRRAVLVRDRGSRWPGDTSAASDCQLHHVDGRDPDGSHPVDELVCLPMRRHQLTVEAHGWTVTVDPATAKATFEHPPSGIRLTSMPRGTCPPHDWRAWHGPLPGWLAPPVPPPPGDPPPEDPPPGVSAPR